MPFKSVERLAQVAVILNIFGNPFRQVQVKGSWRTREVIALAQCAYDQRTLPAGTLDPGRLRCVRH